MSGPMGQWNEGQPRKPNGCCSESAYRWCEEHGYCVNRTYCHHPDRFNKTCAEIEFERKAKRS